MKEVKAYVRADKLQEILRALQDEGARGMTVIRVDAIGAMADPVANRQRFIRKFSEAYSSIAKIEIVCGDEEADRRVQVVKKHGWTGFPGDGRIFVSSIERCVNIRTGTAGDEAL
jgi:nitrogen regulatory protein P-II 1